MKLPFPQVTGSLSLKLFGRWNVTEKKIELGNILGKKFIFTVLTNDRLISLWDSMGFYQVWQIIQMLLLFRRRMVKLPRFRVNFYKGKEKFSLLIITYSPIFNSNLGGRREGWSFDPPPSLNNSEAVKPVTLALWSI